jgi:ABC-type lipoprotein export system ATPase subunit
MLEINDVSFAYRGGRNLTFDDFSIAPGQHSLLLGDSGSGKTTLLHLLGGLLRGYAGLIKINQTDLATLSNADLDKFRGRNIGFIFQKLHLVTALSVEQNLNVSPWLAGLPESDGRATAVLTGLNLAERKQSKVSTLSQGQAQRVAIARSVMNKPKLILADEPTSALDDKNCEDVFQLLLSTATEAGSTLVIATHDQRLKSMIANKIQLKAS